MQNLPAPKIHIIGTGGTIAGTSNGGKPDDYASGARKVESFVSMSVTDEVDITTEDLFLKNSDDITSSDLLLLAKTLASYLSENKFDGYVITHGTDTMEESAFFLYLMLKTDKPVILTGSMIPGDLPGSDGSGNLSGAISCAVDMFRQKKNGVFVYFNRSLMNAVGITKRHTMNIDCFDDDNENTLISLHNLSNNICDFMGLHNLYDCSNISAYLQSLSEFPIVPVIPFYIDADPGVINYYVNLGCPGMVIAGAGAGEFSKEFIAALSELRSRHIPVIRTSKIKNGPVNHNRTLDSITLNAQSLAPEKAAMLLRILLAIKNIQ